MLYSSYAYISSYDNKSLYNLNIVQQGGWYLDFTTFDDDRGMSFVNNIKKTSKQRNSMLGDEPVNETFLSSE